MDNRNHIKCNPTGIQIIFACIIVMKFISNVCSWLNVINVSSNVRFNTLVLKHAEYIIFHAFCYVNQVFMKHNL